MARAELNARAAGWRVEWEPDPFGEADFVETWSPQDQRAWHAADHACEWVRLVDAEGATLASLGGIWDADAEDRREVAAELALEALAEVGR